MRDCFATNFYRYAMGRLGGAADECSLDQVKTRFNGRAEDLRELLVAITLSDAFRYRPAIAAGGTMRHGKLTRRRVLQATGGLAVGLPLLSALRAKARRRPSPSAWC